MWGCWSLSSVLRGREATKRQAVQKYLSSCYLANSFSHSEWVWKESGPLSYSISLIYFLFVLTLYINAHSYTSSGQNWTEHREKCQHRVYLPSAAVIQSCGIPDANTPPALGPTVTSETMGSLSAAAGQEFRWDNPRDASKFSSFYSDFRGPTTVLPCVGFTWQDFDGLKDSFRVGFCGKIPEATSVSGTASFT